MLPPEARTQTLTAVVRQEGPRLTVVLEGARFFVDCSRTFNRFSGTAEREPCHVLHKWTARTSMWTAATGPTWSEQLTDTTLFTMSGSVLATVSSAGVSGTLDGLVEAVQGNEPEGFPDNCLLPRSPTGHQFVLSR